MWRLRILVVDVVGVAGLLRTTNTGTLMMNSDARRVGKNYMTYIIILSIDEMSYDPCSVGS